MTQPNMVNDFEALISVVMSTYNERQWIPTVVPSVLNQNYPHMEFLITSDMADEGTNAYLSRINDPRVKVYYNTERHGFRNCINSMAAAARGALILVLSPDDYLLPNCLSKVAALFSQQPDVGYIFTDYVAVDQRGAHIPEHHPKFPKGLSSGQTANEISWRAGCVPRSSAVFFSSAAWREHQGFRELTASNPERIPTDEDWDLMVRMHASREVGFIDEPLVAVRFHDQQTHRELRLSALNTEARIFVLRLLRDSMLAQSMTDQRSIVSDYHRIIATEFLTGAFKLLLRGHGSVSYDIVRLALSEVGPLTLVPSWVRHAILPSLLRRVQRLTLNTKPS